MTAPRDVLVVVPTYNEKQNLERMVGAIRGHGYQLVVVDDASPDGTGRLADSLAGSDSHVTVVHRPEKTGLGPAYAAGFREGIGSHSIVCQMDCDFSHDPSDLPRLVEAIESGAEVAVGSRYVPGGSTPDWPLLRRLISRGGNWYARTLLGTEVRDATSGYRAFTTEALSQLDPDTCQASGYGFQVEMAWRAERLGLNIVEIPIVFRDRQAGDSKMNGRIVAEAMWLVTRWGVQRLTGRSAAWTP